MKQRKFYQNLEEITILLWKHSSEVINVFENLMENVDIIPNKIEHMSLHSAFSTGFQGVYGLFEAYVCTF